MKKILLTVIILIYSANFASASPPDSCLKLVFAHDPSLWQSNPDSVHVDSCFDSPTYLKPYANRHFFLNFVDYYYPFDVALYANDVRTVDEMTNSRPELKSKFQEFEAKYGNIYFKGLEWDTLGTPINEILVRAVVRVVFEKYQLIEEIETAFRNEVDSLEFKSSFFINYPTLGVSVRDYDIENSSIIIYPNPASNHIDIELKEAAIAEKIEIYNIYGKKIYEQYGNQRIDISNLTQGTYYVKVNNKVQKFLVVR